MKVILKEDVENLGNIGDMIDVARGYARNYLFPRELALEANPRNIKKLEHEKRVIAEKVAKLLKDAEKTADALNTITLTFEHHVGEEDKLFGSVTNKDIAEALSEKGYEIDKRKIMLEEPIKRLGTYKATVKLSTDVHTEVNIEVLKKEE